MHSCKYQTVLSFQLADYILLRKNLWPHISYEYGQAKIHVEYSS